MLSAFKNFLITFLIAALIFGVVGYFTASYVSGVVSDILDGEKEDLEEIISHTPEDTKDNETEEPVLDPDLKVPEGDSFTFIVVGTDYRPDMYKSYYHTYDELDELAGGFTDPEATVGILDTDVRYVNATWIVLIRADKENREYVTTYISPETLVSAPTGDVTLGDVYGRYGMSALCEYIEAMTRLDIDYSMIIDGINGQDFLASMGSVKFGLDCDIYSGGSQHISASTSVETILVTENAPDSAETDNDAESSESESHDEPEEKDPAADDNDNEDNAEGDPEEAPAETEIIDNTLVLNAGNQNLSDYSVHIINTFKELSGEDINVKSTYILDMAEAYLKKCSEWSEEELTSKITELCREKNYAIEDDSWVDPETLPIVNGEFDDPYASKPVLATDLSPEMITEIYSMLEAIEYFDYIEYVYPGTYSESDKMYVPDTKAALDFFAKYNNN